jgi:hypothetical protein
MPMNEIGKSLGTSSASIRSNAASEKSSENDARGTPGMSSSILPRAESTERMTVSNLPSEFGPPNAKAVSEFLARCQVLNISNPSNDELMFLALCEEFGMTAACFFERRLSLKCERIRKALAEDIRLRNAAYANRSAIDH